MKSDRQAKILQLISKYPIETQEELLNKLLEEKICVTQATVSRDIKELRLIKMQDGNGRYKYVTASGNKPTDISAKFYSIFTQSVIDVDYAQNIVVLKCYTGMASAACASLDSVHWDDGLVGTLAGDDTVFLLLRDNMKASQLTAQLKNILKNKQKYTDQ